MTRKKSNVKALALAVTCAILAGGGIGLEPVYAAADDVTYDSAGSTLKYEVASTSGGSTTPTEIKKLVVNGVTIGSANGEITASKIVGMGTDPSVEINGVKIGAVSDGSVTMHTIGSAITISGTSTAMYDVNIGNNLTVKGQIIDSNDVSKAVSVAALADAVGQVETNRINIINNKNDIAGLKTKTTGISYSTATGTIVDGVQLKEKGISAAGGAFTVNGTDGETVVSGIGGKTTINHSSIVIEDTTSSKHVIITNEDVNASHSVQAKIIDSNTTARMADGNVVAKNGLYVGAADITAPTKDNSKFSVDGTTGDTAVGGNLSVAGETTFANGIKTDTIVEKTANAGVTVNGNKITTDNKFNDVELKNGNVNATDITANGALKGQTLGIGGTANDQFTVEANGNTNVGGTLDVTGATTLKDTLNVKGATTLGSTLDVTGKTTLKDELQVDKKATFGNATGLHTVIEGGNITAGGMLNSGSAKIGSVGIDNTGAITGVTSLTTDALTVTGAFTTGGNLTVNGDLTASGAINGKTISINDGGSIAGVNFETGGKLTATTGTIGDVSFAAGGNVSGISELTATTIKDGAGTIITGGKVESKTAKIGAINIDNETIEGSSANGLSIEGVKIKDGVMSSVVSIEANKATIGGVNTLDNKGLTVKAGSKVQVGTNTVIEDGSVQVSQKTSLTDQSLQLNDTNKWTNEGGLVADKATVNGIALGTDSQGKATFSDAAGNTTTIDGNKITTGTITADELNVDKISLGKGTDKNITIGSNGDVTTKGDVTVTGDDNDTTVIDGAKATFGNDVANQTAIDKGKISANAKDINNQQAGLTFDENGLTVNGQNAEGKTSAFGFNTKKGIGTFKGLDETTTTVNGSVITSIKSATDTGVLNGSNLTLVNGDNKTELTAGGVSFTGKKGASAQEGNKTTIDGGIITTDTLKVQRIQLGEKIVDQRTGETIGSGVTLASDGGFTAAGGNFKVTGGTTGSKGSIKNVVGDATNGKTAFETNQQGANMSFEKGGIKSEVAVADDSAKISAGASSIEVKNDGITNNGVTTFNGTTGTTTKIDGGTITTNHLITDKLTITGSGNADGTGSTTGSIAFGGNGSITSNIKDAATGKEATFKTDEKGTFTEAKDNDGNKTTNTVNAKGNTNVVTDSTNTSTATQTATSIGGVVTNGTVTMRQELTADGVKVSVDGDTANYTQITNKDVSITDQKNPGKRINLSDLGQLNDLDGELAARDEYQDNKTAVGAINAEAGIRREEVARLDNRIDDVNNRVDKVGAMAAAIASLKSIGYDPQAPSEFSIGLGQYKGETGVAMGFFHYPNKNFMINVSLSTAGGETMGGIGATWRFGHKSPQKLLEEQREEQAKKELAAAEKYQAAAKLAKEAQERAEYAAKLARQAQVSADNAKAAADATQAKHFG